MRKTKLSVGSCTFKVRNKDSTLICQTCSKTKTKSPITDVLDVRLKSSSLTLKKISTLQKQVHEGDQWEMCSLKFAKFLRRSLSLIKLQAWGMQLYQKKDSNTSVFLWILQNFQEHPFYRTPPVVASVMWRSWPQFWKSHKQFSITSMKESNFAKFTKKLKYWFYTSYYDVIM